MLMPSVLFRNNIFDDFFEDFDKPLLPRFSGEFFTPANHLMKTDVKEKKDEYRLAVELPGFNREDIKAQLKDGYLTISAEHNSEADEKDEDDNFIRRERYYGSCQRSFYVGDNITEEDIKAKFENGVLKLIVPKKEAVPEVEENKYIAIS